MPIRLPKPLQREEDSRKNWVAINQLIAAQSESQREMRWLREVVKIRGRGDFNTVLEPFEVFYLPLSRYPESEKSAAEDTWWRTFKVQHGYTNFVKTEKCVDSDGEGVTPEDIIVPAETAVFYIWCDFTNASAPTLAHTTIAGSVATHWESYPELPAGIRPIAKITTTTTRATVRQLQHGNIWPSGSGGGLPTWLP